MGWWECVRDPLLSCAVRYRHDRITNVNETSEPVVRSDLNHSRAEIHAGDLAEGRAVDLVVDRRSEITRSSGRYVERRMVHEIEEVEPQIQRMALREADRFLHRCVPRPLPWTREHPPLQIADRARAGVEEKLTGKWSGAGLGSALASRIQK